jgi:hypothetical protein
LSVLGIARRLLKTWVHELNSSSEAQPFDMAIAAQFMRDEMRIMPALVGRERFRPASATRRPER